MADTRTILVHSRRGDFIVDGIPKDAKVTFSNGVNPSRPFGSDNCCLRIYTTQSNQLAVFTEVISFRDLSLKVKEKKVTRQEAVEVKSGPDERSSETESRETFEWVDVSVPVPA